MGGATVAVDDAGSFIGTDGFGERLGLGLSVGRALLAFFASGARKHPRFLPSGLVLAPRAIGEAMMAPLFARPSVADALLFPGGGSALSSADPIACSVYGKEYARVYALCATIDIVVVVVVVACPFVRSKVGAAIVFWRLDACAVVYDPGVLTARSGKECGGRRRLWAGCGGWRGERLKRPFLLLVLFRLMLFGALLGSRHAGCAARDTRVVGRGKRRWARDGKRWRKRGKGGRRRLWPETGRAPLPKGVTPGVEIEGGKEVAPEWGRGRIRLPQSGRRARVPCGLLLFGFFFVCWCSLPRETGVHDNEGSAGKGKMRRKEWNQMGRWHA